MIHRDALCKNGRALWLAYDQGFEHGTADFNDQNIDPNYIIDIAKKSHEYSAIIFHEGVAEHYYPNIQQDVPLIVKLNGKTSLQKHEDPYSPQLCSVKEAKRLGATAVGYTIYIGSTFESTMMKEFSRIEDEAHELDMLVALWAYPRGKQVVGKELDRDIVAYGARIALEMGADFVKLPYTGDKESFSWVVKSAGQTGVLVQGGVKKDVGELVRQVSDCIEVGALGLAVGRNVWQSDDPIAISHTLGACVYGR